MIVRDGEGITRVVTVRVTGAKSSADADAAARAVGNSALVKTSGAAATQTGADHRCAGLSLPPWSRKKSTSPQRHRHSEESFFTQKRTPYPHVIRHFAKQSSDEFDLHINLNLGQGEAILYAADLTEEYVDLTRGHHRPHRWEVDPKPTRDTFVSP